MTYYEISNQRREPEVKPKDLTIDQKKSEKRQKLAEEIRKELKKKEKKEKK